LTLKRPTEAGHHPDRTTTGIDIVIIMTVTTEDETIRQGGGPQEVITHPPRGETDPGDLLLLQKEPAA